MFNDDMNRTPDEATFTTVLSLRQKVASPGLTKSIKRLFSAFGWPRHRSAGPLQLLAQRPYSQYPLIWHPCALCSPPFVSEIYSLTTATSCRLLDRTNEMRSFRTIVRCCSLVRPQRSRSSQLYGRVPYNWDAYNRILTVSYKRKLPLRAVFVSLQHTYTPNSADPSRICSKLFTR